MTQTADNGRQLSRVDQIESRIDKAAVSTIGVSAQSGMAVTSMGQAMEVAKLMSVSGCAVPRHLRGNPGACLAVAIQGYEWGINPFAIANKTYEVNDRLSYESALYQAILHRRAPIKGRIQMAYSGEGQSRKCRVWAEMAEGGIAEYTSPAFATIQPKNSPLWKNDPDQQLFYFSVRSFARRHFADVMMGIYTVDEMMDSPVTAQPAERGAAALNKRITQRPVSEGQTFEADPAAAEAAHVEQQRDEQATVNVQTGELAEADVSGADAEPPQREDPAELAAVLTVQWEDFEPLVRAKMKEAGAKKPDIDGGIFEWGQGHPDKAEEERRELYFAVVEKRFDYAKGLIVSA